MELVLISYPQFFKNETKIVTHLLKEYDFIFHLRKPVVKDIEYIEFLRQIPEKLHNKIVIHSSYEKLKDYHLRGLHFSSSCRPEKPKSTEGKILSTSCHSIEEIKTLPKEFTHCFLSPLFPSVSKQGYDNVLNRKELRSFLKKARKVKVIGLGGISQQRLIDFTGYSFDGYAFLGAVWGDHPNMEKDIENNFRKIYKCIMNGHIV